MVPDKNLLKARLAHERMQAIHEGPMRKMLHRLASTDDAHVVKDIFYCWKEDFVQRNLGNHRDDISRFRRLHQRDVRILISRDITAEGLLCLATHMAAWFKVLEDRKLKSLRKKAMGKAGDAIHKAIAKWSDAAPSLMMRNVLGALWQEAAASRQARSKVAVRELRTAWRLSAFQGSRHLMRALEARVRAVFLTRWHGVASRAKSRRFNRCLQENLSGRPDFQILRQMQAKMVMAWAAVASRQRCESFAVECQQLSEQAREASVEALGAMRANDTLRHALAVNLLGAEQRAEEALEFSDKLGIVTGTLSGEMHGHNLTLDALEHEVLLMEAQITGSDLYLLKKGSTTLVPALTVTRTLIV